MSIIKSPFNFVPLSDKVFFPDWASQISQDVPFSDGVSGTIELTITAQSPIFIRNGHTKDEGPDKNGKFKSEEAKRKYNSFSHIDGPDGKPIYFIPATSIKGEVRNLLEIMSFSKMTVDPRAKFARRDLRDKVLYPLMTHQKEIHGGWLHMKSDNSGYVIEDCGRPMRISQPDIDYYLGTDVLKRNFSKRRNHDPLPDNHKTATFKYSLVDEQKLHHLRFSEKADARRRDGATQVVYDPAGYINGTIVLTGQSGYWKPEDVPGRGKYHEFVFSDDFEGQFNLTNEEFDFFKFIYQDADDWPRISKLLNDKKSVPVFFRVKKVNDEDKIEDFGMAYLYKLPYRHSVFEALPESHRSSDADLAECIFGFCNKDEALKGRVHFGNAIAVEGTAIADGEYRRVLSSPKASYYPIYVKQDGSKGITSIYKTYDDGQPSGWKRYHVRSKLWGSQTGSDKQDTLLHPLKKGAKFKGSISFHNLRPVELGALISALTFHGNSSFLHQLGQGKPYGFGMCLYDIKLNVISTKTATLLPQDYLGRFELVMDNEMGKKWVELPQISELLIMAKTRCQDTPEFKYMAMSNTPKDNEFLQVKQEKLYLQPASTQLGVSPYITKSQISEETREAGKREKEKQEKRIIQAEKEERLKAASKLAEQFKGQIKVADKTSLTTIKKQYELDLKEFTDIISQLNEAIEARTKEIENATANAGLEAFFPKATSTAQCQGRVKQWLKTTKHSTLTNEEADYIFSFFPQLYSSGFKEADKKKWAKIVGEELANAWAQKLNKHE